MDPGPSLTGKRGTAAAAVPASGAVIVTLARGYLLPTGHGSLRCQWRVKETALTDQKISPRFVFLDEALETTQIGPDSFIDAYPSVDRPQFEVSKAGDTVRIQLTAQDAGYQSALEWPSPGSEPVEIGPALLEVLEGAPQSRNGKTARELAEQIRAFMSRTDR
jgi:hypothetical protein